MSNMNRGPLVKVQLSPGRWVKMYEKDAIEKGLLIKQRKQSENKMIQPQEEKKIEPVLEKAEWDDFTEIHGVGKATDEQLHAHGVHIYDQLLNAPIEYLNPKAKQAIKDWRENLTGEVSVEE